MVVDLYIFNEFVSNNSILHFFVVSPTDLNIINYKKKKTK